MSVAARAARRRRPELSIIDLMHESVNEQAGRTLGHLAEGGATGRLACPAGFEGVTVLAVPLDSVSQAGVEVGAGFEAE